MLEHYYIHSLMLRDEVKAAHIAYRYYMIQQAIKSMKKK